MIATPIYWPQKKKVKLYAPPEYWALSEDAKKEIVNGCGPAKFGYLVPDSLCGLDITPVCNIHDYMYHIGETLEDKKLADRAFLNNLIRLIDVKTQWWVLKQIRLRMAYVYYTAVKRFGGPAFWAGKNSDAEFQHVEA